MDLIEWDTIYYRLANGQRVEMLSLQTELQHKLKRAADEAFDTDRHSFSKPVQELPMSFSTASFMGENDQDEVYVFFGIEESTLRKKLAQYEIE